jgi:hypothetical protein
MDNPYLEEFVKTIPPDAEEARVRKQERFAMCGRYAWSVPTDEAIEALVRHSPLVELGAGTGYWAWLVRNAGGDIVAYDVNPPGQPGENTWHSEARTCFTPVGSGSIEVLSDHVDRTLVLCWPPYSDQDRPTTLAGKKAHLRECMGYQALRHWKGERFVYIGEWRCCTAGWAFHDLLERDYRWVSWLKLPSWPGVDDYLTVYERVRRVWSVPADWLNDPMPAPRPSPDARVGQLISPLGP